MAQPTSFPKGLSTFPQKSILASYPLSTSPAQIAYTEDFLPYRSGDYTVTTAVAGTVATFPWLGGMVKLATSASATDTIFLWRNGTGFQVMPQGRFWYNARVAYPRAVLNANDTAIYIGLFGSGTFSTSTDGMYFLKPAGGTAVHFVIKKNNVTTTFQNVADLAVPSGLFNDTNSVNGTLNAVVAGNAFTGISVATPGAGYAIPPLVLTTAASGVAGNTPAMVGLASTAYTASNPQVPVLSTGLPYGSLGAPYITAGGSGYTNSAGTTTYFEVDPLIDLSIYYNGNGTLQVGVNGRCTLAIQGNATATGVVGVAAGATVNVATGISPSYYSTTQLTTAVMPFQLSVGSPVNLMPLVALGAGVGFTNTTVNVRNFYLAELNVACELTA